MSRRLNPCRPTSIGCGTSSGSPRDDATVLKCFLLWAALVGAISLEVFGQYGADTLTDPAVVFDGQVGLLIDAFTR